MFELQGLFFGMAFGILLQRAHVLRYDKQLAMLRLKDMTVLKFMLSAAISAMALIYIFDAIDYIELPQTEITLGPVIIGGLIFGIGWAILGYCPGTALGAVGEGRLDALAGILGMILGGIVYYFTYLLFADTVYPLGEVGYVNMAELLRISPRTFILLFALGCGGLLWWLERSGR
jgi:hypothetical protein